MRGPSCLQITPTAQSVKEFVQRTLCFHQRNELRVDVLEEAEKALQLLHEMGLISHKSNDSSPPTLETTRLGRAVFKGSILSLITLNMKWKQFGMYLDKCSLFRRY
jgi:hypothetical protein